MSLTDDLFMAKLHVNILRLIVSTRSCLTSVMNFTTLSCSLHRQKDLWHISLSAIESQASVKRTIDAVRESLRQNKRCVWVSQDSWSLCASARCSGRTFSSCWQHRKSFYFPEMAAYYISTKPETFAQGHLCLCKTLQAVKIVLMDYVNIADIILEYFGNQFEELVPRTSGWFENWRLCVFIKFNH